MSWLGRIGKPIVSYSPDEPSSGPPPRSMNVKDWKTELDTNIMNICTRIEIDFGAQGKPDDLFTQRFNKFEPVASTLRDWVQSWPTEGIEMPSLTTSSLHQMTSIFRTAMTQSMGDGVEASKVVKVTQDIQGAVTQEWQRQLALQKEQGPQH